MKRLKNLIWALPLILAAAFHTACSDEKTSVDPDLGKLDYIPAPGAPGTLQEAIYNLYEKYGIVVRTEYTDTELRWQWGVPWAMNYVPVKPGHEESAMRMISFINTTFEDYQTEVVRKNISYMIFFVDQITSAYTGEVLNISPKSNNAYIIGNINPALPASQSAKEWIEVRDKMLNDFNNKSFDPNVQPEMFYDLAWKQPGTNAFGGVPFIEDPYGDYTTYDIFGDPNTKAWYSVMLAGYIFPVELLPGYGIYTGNSPSKAADYSDYLAFLTGKPYAFIEKVMIRFPWCRKRAIALIDFLIEEKGLNLENIQKKNCPADPLPEDYYTTLKTRQFDDSQLPPNPYRQ